MNPARVKNVGKAQKARVNEGGQAYSPVEDKKLYTQPRSMVADFERHSGSLHLSDRQLPRVCVVQVRHTARHVNGNQQNEQDQSTYNDRRLNREINRGGAAGGDFPSDGSDSDDGSDDRYRKPCRRIKSRRDLSPRRLGRRSSSPDHASSDHNYHPKSRRWMKPEKFDGHSSFETFICMFENCCDCNKWDEEHKVAHLRWSLTGIAAQLV